MKKVLLSLAVFLVVSLATYAAVRAVLSDPDGHTVKLRSVPPGAIVTVDGVPLATTPCEAEDLATGPHEFSFVASGYRKRVVNTSVTEDTELSVKLEQYASSLLTVRTQPSAARVFIDGIEAGTSPLGRKLAPGKHTVSAVMKNYEEAIETVELAEGENSELTLQLQPSVVTYYTQLIESEPHNLYHHCDLMRYYYVKGEYEKLCTVIEMALEQIASPPSSNTAEGNVHWKSRSRFVQELGKTKGDDMKLYEEALRPHYLALVQESPHKDIAIQYIVFNYYAGRLNKSAIPLSFDSVITLYAQSNYAEYVLEGLREINSSFARHFLRKTAAKVILKQLRESVSVLPSERAYSLLDAFGYSLLKARNYPFAVQTFEYVLKTFKAPESEAELWTRGHLIYCLNRQKKFSEALAEVEKLLGRDELPADLRKRMKSEHHYATQNLERLKRKNKR